MHSKSFGKDGIILMMSVCLRKVDGVAKAILKVNVTCILYTTTVLVFMYR